MESSSHEHYTAVIGWSSSFAPKMWGSLPDLNSLKLAVHICFISSPIIHSRCSCQSISFHFNGDGGCGKRITVRKQVILGTTPALKYVE